MKRVLVAGTRTLDAQIERGGTMKVEELSQFLPKRNGTADGAPEQMSRLEIIHLRSSGEPIESLADRIRESIWSEGDQTEVVTIFRRNGLETDLAVHIHHPEAPGADVPSRLGLQLVSSLAVFGLVEHSVWEELK